MIPMNMRMSHDPFQDSWIPNGWTIVVLSIIIVFMFIIGLFLSSMIVKHEEDKNLRYNQAVHITDQSQFEQAFETDIGDAFVYGRFDCDGVSYDKIPGKYLRIEVTHQRYTQHTRIETYTTTDSKGRTQTHTKTVHYWSWDNIGDDEMHCHVVRFKGKSFGYSNFDSSSVPSNDEVVRTGFNLRDVITTYPMAFNCTVFCNMRRHSFCETAKIYYEVSPDIALKVSTRGGAVFAFWAGWILFTGLICGAYINFRKEMTEQWTR